MNPAYPHKPLSSILKIRFYTSYNPCNFACEYCITTERGEGGAEKDRAQRPLPIITRIGKNLASPKNTMAKARAFAKNPSMLFSRKGPAVWSDHKYMRIIERIKDLPYHIDLRIGVGGEFFLDKTLATGARRLSQYDNVVALNLISNLSFKYDQYTKIFQGYDLSKVALVCSYHATQVKDREAWLETAARIGKIVDLAIILVAWPPVLPQLPEIKAEFAKRGLFVFAQAFNGWYAGRKYPEAYTNEERKILRSIFLSRHDYAHMVDLKTPGTCHAGVDYVLMDIDGNIFRCGGFHVPYGNIFSGFTLLKKPEACPVSECWCDTDNLNTQAFHENYEMLGLNQHKYVYRYAGQAKASPSLDEWSIDY